MNTKQRVLEQLERNKGKPVSGTKLAYELKRSRTAVWKAINSLREEGFPIHGTGGKGYTLDHRSDLLTAEGILPYMNEPVPLHIYNTLESTNKTAASLAMDDCPQWTTVIAGKQTMGKGRRGRSFYSPADTGIYMSIVVKPSFDVSKAVLITTAASVAVAKAIEKVSGKSPLIKWVNDLYVDGKKVCGILTEALTDFESGRISHVIVGIGINCFTIDFPKEAGPLAGSIMGDFSKNRLVANIIQEIKEILESLSSNDSTSSMDFMEYYRHRSMVIGKDILVHKTGVPSPMAATAIGIDEEGGLKVDYENGRTETLQSGEITIRFKS